MKALVTMLALLGAAAVALAEEPERDAQGFLIERDTVEIKPHQHVEVTEISVDNRLGDVTVVGHDEPEVLLTVVKRAPDGDTLDRLKVNLVPDPSGTITIGSALLLGEEARPIPAGSVRIDISLVVPRGAHIDVKAWRGKIAVTGMRAGAALAAHEAEITVTDVRGPLTTTNTRGRQRITSVRGAVTADNTFGDVDLDGISGDSLAASVHEGNVVATRVRSRKVKLRTTFGDIQLTGELLAGGRYDIRSYQGDIDVRVAPGMSFRIDAYARDGAVDPQLELAEVDRPEAGRLIGTYGPARKKPALLELSSTAGVVRLGLIGD